LNGKEAERLILADLHIHSTFSDGDFTIPEIVDLYGTRGFGAIAITDHLTEVYTILGRCAIILRKTLTVDTFGEYVATIRSESLRARHEYGMCVIPGFEISKNYVNPEKASHILALDVEKFIPADMSCESIIDRIHENGGFAVGAHPVFSADHKYQTLWLWKQKETMCNLLDAWETANRTNFFPSVYESGYPVIASSDLHKARHMNGWRTVLFCEADKEAIFDAVRNRNVDFVFYRDMMPVFEDHILQELSEQMENKTETRMSRNLQ
jgi:histidinol phosphatase-like PHP family hydrolase